MQTRTVFEISVFFQLFFLEYYKSTDISSKYYKTQDFKLTGYFFFLHLVCRGFAMFCGYDQHILTQHAVMDNNSNSESFVPTCDCTHSVNKQWELQFLPLTTEEPGGSSVTFINIIIP